MAKKKESVKDTEKVDTGIATIQSELKPIETEIVSLKDRAQAIIIKDDKGYEDATNILDVIMSKKKALEKMRKFFVDPLNQQVKNINAMFKPQVEATEEVEMIVKGSMKKYFDEKEAARIKEEARLQKIRDKANAKRAEQGKEAIAEPIREVAAPAKFVNTGTAKAQVRKFWTHEIISIDALPDDVKKAIFAEAYRKGIIKSVVQKFVDAGMREMTGVRIFEDTLIAGGGVRKY